MESFVVHEVQTCNICTKKFATPRELKKHQKRYHPEDPQALNCTNCGKTFTTVYNKIDHEESCSASMYSKFKLTRSEKIEIHEPAKVEISKDVNKITQRHAYSNHYLNEALTPLLEKLSTFFASGKKYSTSLSLKTLSPSSIKGYISNLKSYLNWVMVCDSISEIILSENLSRYQ